MALIECPDCGEEVSDEEATCPYCGNPFFIEDDEIPEVIYECEKCGSQFEEAFTVCPKCGYSEKGEQAGREQAVPLQPAGDKSKAIKIAACVVAVAVVLCLAFALLGSKADVPTTGGKALVSTAKITSEPIVGKWEGVSVFDSKTKKSRPLAVGASSAEFKKDGSFTLRMNDAKLEGTWRTMENPSEKKFDAVYVLSVGSDTAAGIQDGKLMIKIENYLEVFERVK